MCRRAVKHNFNNNKNTATFPLLHSIIYQIKEDIHSNIINAAAVVVVAAADDDAADDDDEQIKTYYLNIRDTKLRQP